MPSDQPEPQQKRPLPPQFPRETARIRQVASNPDCWFRWMLHAEERMEQYGRVADDVIAALINGHVVRINVMEDVVFRVVGKNMTRDDEGSSRVLNDTTIKVITVI